MEEFSGEDVETVADQLSDFYVEVTGSPDRERFRRRLAVDSRRPGFRAVADISFDQIYGFATGWPTVAADRAEHLVGTVEVNQLVVRHREGDTGRTLLTSVTGGHPAWLHTAADARAEIAFYRDLGWRAQEPVPSRETDVVVFLSPSPGDLTAALPMHDVKVKSRGFGGAHCGGGAKATVDLEPAAGAPLEIVDATIPSEGLWWDDELVPMCLENLAHGIIEQLTAQYADDRPAMRVVVRDLWPHVVDANEWTNRDAGRRIVHEAVRRAAG